VKVTWFGSSLLEPVYVEPPTGMAAVLERVLRDGAELVLVVGAKPMDPLDPIFAALAAVGARMDRLGFPAHPGSLLWLARLEQVVILGIPSQALLARATALDIALPHILVSEPPGSTDLAGLGHGGLLTPEMAFRLPRYVAGRPRGEVAGDG
jgi:molybdenum cofactor cytidylyltransferase